MPQAYSSQPVSGHWFQSGYRGKKLLWGISIPYLVVFIILALSLIIFALVQLTPKTNTAGPRIYNVKVEYISKTGAKITWYTDELASTQIEYGRTNNYGSLYPVNPNNDIRQFKDAGVLYHEITISTLQTGTLYYFRAIAFNAQGYKSYSAENSFKTKYPNDPFINAED